MADAISQQQLTTTTTTTTKTSSGSRDHQRRHRGLKSRQQYWSRAKAALA
jgi:hypothetical protein